MRAFRKALLVGVLVPFAALADDRRDGHDEGRKDERDVLVKFKGGIGVIPVSSGVAIPDSTQSDLVNRNFVRDVAPPGQIWVIKRLEAVIFKDGKIEVKGKGLLLGGGNNVGLNGNASVFATLICTPAAPFEELNTDPAGVPLEKDGDFEIHDVLHPKPPHDCESPVLLIRNANNRAWFAAGIPKHDEDDGKKEKDK
jgi:hypothetical protein